MRVTQKTMASIARVGSVKRAIQLSSSRLGSKHHYQEQLIEGCRRMLKDLEGSRRISKDLEGSRRISKDLEGSRRISKPLKNSKNYFRNGQGSASALGVGAKSVWLETSTVARPEI